MTTDLERDKIYNIEIKQKYKDTGVAESYDSQRYRDTQGELNTLLLRQSLGAALYGLDGNSVVLDAPCGTGRFTDLLTDRGFRALGGDISREMMITARRKFDGRAEKPSFIQFDLERMPFKNKSISAVMNIRFMVHVPEEVRVNILKEFKRVVRNRAVVCYYHTYYLTYVLRTIRSFIGLGKKRNPGGRVGFGQLASEAARAGMKIRKISPLMLGVSGNWIVEMEP